MHRQSKRCRPCQITATARPENYCERSCEKCGKAFSVHISVLARGQGRCCSHACSCSLLPRRKKDRLTVTCHVCGDLFEKYRAEIRKNVGDRHFCSPECWYEFNQRDNHYLWSGGQHERMCPEAREWRQAVIRRDQGYCRLCYVRRELQVHHIKPFSTHKEERWNVENGITLCRSCHAMFLGCEMEDAAVLAFAASRPFVYLGEL